MIFICKIIIVSLSIFVMQSEATEVHEKLYSQLNTCCKHGVEFLNKNQNCLNYDESVSLIQPFWFGLCKSAFSVCCLQEHEKLLCNKGQALALAELDCDTNSTSTMSKKCCDACQLGLALKKSQNECKSPLEGYSLKVMIKCCMDSNEDEEEITQEDPDVLEIPNKTNEGSDDEIILTTDDDDICEKVPNLCQHICVNTDESYRCMCKPGFKLEANGVTCVEITSFHNKDEDLEEDGDELEEEEDYKNCATGYKYDLEKDDCIDIDECDLNPKQCKINQYCHNTIGSYQCMNVHVKNCKEGYHLDTTLNECVDYNECEDAPCEKGYECINLPGAYDCKAITRVNESLLRKCGEGFRYVYGKCVDIDECKEDLANCGEYQLCENKIGGFDCNCNIGFNRDSTSNKCLDINECSINNHNCLATQRCDNTIGSYICTRLKSCGTGYTLNTATNICDDDDECALNTHNCPADYDCFNTEGFFRCHKRTTTTTTTTTTSTTTSTTTPRPYSFRPYSLITPNQQNNYFTFNKTSFGGRDMSLYTNEYESCGVGFQRNPRGACVDINECLTRNPCGTHQRCINTNGSFRCQNFIDCPSGYRASQDKRTCEDIDECDTGEHTCLSNQICQNKVGGFVCSCLPGFKIATSKFGHSNCVDIDECEQSSPQICPLNSYCRNTVGSYHCECKPGFERSSNNENLCVDVDECQKIHGLCQQKCVNFWGGYRCTCQSGYELGYDNRTCNDIDECEVHKDYKICMGFCNNVPGSYECSCPRGYTLAADKSSCRDIDECASGNFCTGRNDICTNTKGNYRCHTINCPFGYENDQYQKNRCRIISALCEGEECYSKPSAYTFNFITLISKLLIPPEGRTIFTLRGPHWYDDIDFDLKLTKIQVAANIEKATKNHFKTVKGAHEVSVVLMRSLEGPQDIELELSMTVFTKGFPRGKSVAKIFILVSQYSF